VGHLVSKGGGQLTLGVLIDVVPASEFGLEGLVGFGERRPLLRKKGVYGHGDEEGQAD
jgi:hypothetical protein